MKNLDKVFTNICIALGTFALILLFSDCISVETFLSALVLLVTALVIGKQAFATEKMVEFQLIPSIEMFLIKDKSDGHCFAFYNLSSVPGKISFNLSFQKHETDSWVNYGNKSISYRIPPQGYLITETTFFVNDLPKGIEIKRDLIVNIDAVIIPDLDMVRADTKRTYKKVYKFNDEEHRTLANERWNESTIGFPDILLFYPENTGLRESVEFLKKKYMGKDV